MDPASLLQGRTRETKIRRDAAGRWFNDGVAITHSGLTRAFDAWLRPAPDGSARWCLSNDINWAYVEVEGPGRFVRDLALRDGTAWLELSDGREVALDPATLRRGPDEALYCDVPLDDATVTARFDSHATLQLAEVVGEDDEGVYVELGGARHRPPRVDALGPSLVRAALASLEAPR